MYTTFSAPPTDSCKRHTVFKFAKIGTLLIFLIFVCIWNFLVAFVFASAYLFLQQCFHGISLETRRKLLHDPTIIIFTCYRDVWTPWSHRPCGLFVVQEAAGLPCFPRVVNTLSLSNLLFHVFHRIRGACLPDLLLSCSSVVTVCSKYFDKTVIEFRHISTAAFCADQNTKKHWLKLNLNISFSLGLFIYLVPYLNLSNLRLYVRAGQREIRE